MMRRTSIGVACVFTLVVTVIGVLPQCVRAQTTLQICVIQNPGDTCASVGASTMTTLSAGSGRGSGPISESNATTTPLAFDPASGEVFFSGSAHPSSVVTLMLEGQFLATTTAGSDAAFHFDIKKITPGTYTYEVWAEDGSGVRSVARSFTVMVAKGVGTVVNGIDLMLVDAKKQGALTSGISTDHVSRESGASVGGTVSSRGDPISVHLGLERSDLPKPRADSSGRSVLNGAAIDRSVSASMHILNNFIERASVQYNVTFARLKYVARRALSAGSWLWYRVKALFRWR